MCDLSQFHAASGLAPGGGFVKELFSAASELSSRRLFNTILYPSAIMAQLRDVATSLAARFLTSSMNLLRRDTAMLARDLRVGNREF